MCRVSSGLRVVWSVGGLRRRLVPSLSNAEGWDWMRSVFTGMHADSGGEKIGRRACAIVHGRGRRIRPDTPAAALLFRRSSVLAVPLSSLPDAHEREAAAHDRHASALVRPRRQRRTPLGMPAAMAPTGVQHQNTRKTETQQIELHSKCALTEGASERRMRHKKKKRKKNSNGQRLCFDELPRLVENR